MAGTDVVQTEQQPVFVVNLQQIITVLVFEQHALKNPELQS